MTCSEIVALLPEYIRRRLLATEEAAVRAHLSACPACAAAYEDELAFGAIARGTDTPVPSMVLARVMAGVYAEPRQAAFRVRALDFVLAIGAALAAGGLVIGLLSLWQIRPLVTDLFDPRALLDDGRTLGTITVAALWVVVGLAVSLPIAAMVYAAILRSRRAPLWWSRF